MQKAVYALRNSFLASMLQLNSVLGYKNSFFVDSKEIFLEILFNENDIMFMFAFKN